MEGKVCLVTGGTSGIGKETVRGLATLGAQVVFTARNVEDGESVLTEMKREMPNANVAYYLVDLASFASIRKFVEEFKEKYTQLNVLINNAGVMPQERIETGDKHELNWQVNFLSPFLLTNLLLPLLRAGAPARIINVSSTMHAQGEINLGDLESRKHFDHYRAYSNSKLALILWTKIFAKELKESGVTVNALHPGVVRTNLLKEGMRNSNIVVRGLFSLTTISPKAGAETSVYLASSPKASGVSGEYFVKNNIAEVSPQANDMEAAEKLVSIVKSELLL